MGRREKKLRLDVAEPELRSEVRRQPRLTHNRRDRAGDEVPVFVQMDRNDWLEVEDVLGPVVGPIDERRVVLKLQADEVGDRILSRLAQLVRTLRAALRGFGA